MSSVSRSFAQGAPSVKNVDLTGNGTYSSPAVAEVDLRVTSVFVVDCSDLTVTNGYSQVYVDAESGASGSLSGKEVTFVFKTAAGENGKNAQSLVITFSPNFTKESSVSYTTGVSQLNPDPVITLVTDGVKFSVKTLSYVKSSADPFNPLTNNFLLIGSDDGESSYAISRNNGTTWDINQLGGAGGLDYIYGFAWNGVAWVAAGYYGDDYSVWYSTDAVNWSIPSGNQAFVEGSARAIAWNQALGLWIAGGDSYDDNGNYKGYALAYSPTGYDNWQWTEYDDTVDPIGDNDGQVYAIATSGVNCVAVGSTNNTSLNICTSTDGKTWTKALTNPFDDDSDGSVNTVATNGTIWVAGGYRDNHNVALAWSDNSGVDWTPCTSVGGGADPFSRDGYSQCISVATNGTMWVAGGYGNNGSRFTCLAYSMDGKEWTAVTNDVFSNDDTNTCNAVVWNGSAWFASTYSNSLPILTSQDGIHWTPVSANPFYLNSGYHVYCFGIKHVLPFTPGLPSGNLSPSELAARAEKKAAKKAEKNAVLHAAKNKAETDTRNAKRAERAEQSAKASNAAKAAKDAKDANGSRGLRSQSPRANVDASGNTVSRDQSSRGRRAEKSVVDASGTTVAPRGQSSRGPRGQSSRGEKSVVDASGTTVAPRDQSSRGPRSQTPRANVDASGNPVRVGPRDQSSRGNHGNRGNRSQSSRRVTLVEPVVPVAPVAEPVVPVAEPVAEPVVPTA